MKSLAYTLVALFAALSVAQADAEKKNSTEEVAVAVEEAQAAPAEETKQ